MAFKMMDKDQNGTITKEELKKVLSRSFDYIQNHNTTSTRPS